MPIEIRRVTSDEWRDLRDTRLNSLLDAPDAFGGVFETSEARPEQWWIEWAAESAHSGRQAMYLAWDDGRPVGIAGTFLDEDDRWIVIAMWVRPAHRGQRLGRRLLDAVVGFAREHGAREIFLGVAEGNAEAQKLYEGYGFAENGKVYPLREGSHITVRELKLIL